MWSIPDAVILAIGWWVRDKRGAQGMPSCPPPFKKFKNKQCGVCLGTSTFVCLVTRNLLFGQDLNPISANFLSFRGLGVPGKFGYFGYTEKKHSDLYNTTTIPAAKYQAPSAPDPCRNRIVPSDIASEKQFWETAG
jgi:hypothetical protein